MPRPSDLEVWWKLTVPTVVPDARPGEVRLRADLLPPSTWGTNVRALVTDASWRKLSRGVSLAAGRRCEICGDESIGPNGPQNTDCHEVWAFEVIDGVTVQRLDRLIGLCRFCHDTQHIGRAELLGLGNQVIATLQRVNGWSEPEVYKDIARAELRYKLMEKLEFDLDLRLLEGRVNLRVGRRFYFTAAERAKMPSTWGRRRAEPPNEPEQPGLFELPG